MKLDDIKAKADKYDLKGKAEKAEASAKKAEASAKKAAKAAKEATVTATERAGEMTHKHRDQIEAQLDKAESVVQRHLPDKHAGKVDTVKGWIDRGLDKVAAQRPEAKGTTTAEEPPTTD